MAAFAGRPTISACCLAINRHDGQIVFCKTHGKYGAKLCMFIGDNMTPHIYIQYYIYTVYNANIFDVSVVH